MVCDLVDSKNRPVCDLAVLWAKGMKGGPPIPPGLSMPGPEQGVSSYDAS